MRNARAFGWLPMLWLDADSRAVCIANRYLVVLRRGMAFPLEFMMMMDDDFGGGGVGSRGGRPGKAGGGGAGGKKKKPAFGKKKSFQ